MIYFDSAASYPLLPQVAEALTSSFSSDFANPSSAHALGEQASRQIDEARYLIAEAIGALPSEIIFTSGATEANNLALKAHFLLPQNRAKRHLIISSIEHKCVHAIADFLARTGNVNVTTVKPNAKGIITVDALEKIIDDDTGLISVMHVNNELGTVNPIDEIGGMCFEKGVRFHTDAAQSFLKEPIDVADMDVDFLSLSAHKIGGPKGIGALYVRDRRDFDFEPVIHGAGQESGLRGGTLPTSLITGFAKAVELFPSVYSNLKASALKDYLLDRLRLTSVPFIVNGIAIPSMLSLTLPDTDVAGLIRSSYTELALATGSACSSKEIEVSHVLTALGLSRALAEATLRISFHHKLSTLDIDVLVDRINQFSRA